MIIIKKYLKVHFKIFKKQLFPTFIITSIIVISNSLKHKTITNNRSFVFGRVLVLVLVPSNRRE